MNVQFVMNEGEANVAVRAPGPEPPEVEPRPAPPEEVAATEPPARKKRKRTKTPRRVANKHRAVAPPVMAEDAPVAPAPEDRPDAIQVATSPAPPSPAPVTPATRAGHRGDPGQEAEVDLRGALRGYLKTITHQIHREYTYPRAAQRWRLEGRAVVKITIDATGAVTAVELAESSGHTVLDDAALAAARSFTHLPSAPAELNWTERSIRVPFRYSLTG